jgi:ABC-type transport system substrate-binding protein
VRGTTSKSRPWNALAFLVTVVLPIGACGSDDSGSSVRRSSLTIARPQDVRDINPLRQANNATSEVTYQMHESLFGLSPDQEVIEVLATGWELLGDGLTYRLHLREGVYFHSGAPFNAEAVAWNFEKQLKTEPQRPSRAVFRRAMASDTGRSSGSEVQTAPNIRERAGGRKQKRPSSGLVLDGLTFGRRHLAHDRSAESSLEGGALGCGQIGE